MKNLFSRQKNINSKDPEYILHQYLFRIAKEKYLDFDEKVQKLRQKFEKVFDTNNVILAIK